MRLLDRYLLRELFIPLCYCLSGFLIFWISSDLFNELDDFQEKNLRFLDVVEYYFVRTPELLLTILPIALLLGLLYSLTTHARHHELTAMRAAGVSIWRIALPYLGVGFVFSLMFLAIKEVWAPSNAERIHAIENRRQVSSTNSQTASLFHRNLNFSNERDARVWHIGAYSPKAQAMLNPEIKWRQTDGTLRQIVAARAAWTNGAWHFYHVQEFQFSTVPGDPPKIATTNELVLAELSESPAQINSEIKVTGLMNSSRAAKSAELSIREILNYQALHPQLKPAQAALLNTQLHARLAEPWTCLVVVLIAIPFGAASGRRNVFVGVASSVFICFAYFILQRFGLALGTGGYIPGWLAAWLPNVLFGAIGIWWTSRAR